MRIDWFTGSLGIAETGSDDLAPEVVAKLTDEAEAFLRASGALSWPEWATLSPEGQDAFRVAGDRIRRETAGLMGAAAAREEVAQALCRGEDFDDVKVRSYLEASVAAIEKDIGGRA